MGFKVGIRWAGNGMAGLPGHGWDAGRVAATIPRHRSRPGRGQREHRGSPGQPGCPWATTTISTRPASAVTRLKYRAGTACRTTGGCNRNTVGVVACTYSHVMRRFGPATIYVGRLSRCRTITRYTRSEATDRFPIKHALPKPFSQHRAQRQQHRRQGIRHQIRWVPPRHQPNLPVRINAGAARAWPTAAHFAGTRPGH